MPSFNFLLQKDPFSRIVMGNTAIVRAMVESGTRVVTSYPGSPTPEIADAISGMNPQDRPFYFEFSTNEKVATEVAFGASINGHLSCVFFKSVGLNVAADSFVQLSHMVLKGGMVVVLGDDPGANSSQNEQDNRHYAHLSYTPVLEPANPQEVYDMYLQAADIATKKQMPVILRLTTHVCHAKSRVEFNEWSNPPMDTTPGFDPTLANYIPITNRVHPMKRMALEKLDSLKPDSEKSVFKVDNNNRERGIITSGLTFLSLMDTLQYANHKPDILKLGMVYPIPEQAIKDFLSSHKEVKILEELDNILEKDIKALAFDSSIKCRIIGKSGFDDWQNEYTPEKVHSIISSVWPDMLAKRPEPEKLSVSAPPRPAQMCPGCGHRSAFFAIKKAVGVEDITVADIGCHTLGFLPPYNMGQVLLCMGASPGIGAGLSLFNDKRKVLAFMGDSTFFHAGAAGVINNIFNNHNMTLILMENGTTAMTGHQNHPGVGHNFDEITQKISPKAVFESYGIKVREVDTYQQAKLTAMVKESMDEDGFNVVIARHPCMLKFTREQRRKTSFTPKTVTVDQSSCDHNYTCISSFGCPSFFITDEGNVTINEDLCIGDGSCIQTCPSDAIDFSRNKKEK
ncbi:MAG: 4Fe-4S binding protein [Deltaproteobacteria bacterium]|nr:4Fe-4S binding protein [Deltaproteobacteria bacterium]